MAERSAKVYYLDGIRGVAAFAVMIHHLVFAFLPAFYTLDKNTAHMGNQREAWLGDSLVSVFINGNFAVCLFFVLSGYVLSRQFFLSGQIETLVSGASRRFIRLYVPVAVTILLAYLLLKAGWFYNVPASKVAHSESWMGNMWVIDNPEQKLLAALTYATMFKGDNTFNYALWSISYEFYGSLLVFTFLALTFNTRNRALPLLALMIYFIAFGMYYYLAFLVGIALHFTKHWEIRHRLWNIVCSTLILLLGLVMGAHPVTGSWLPDVPQQQYGGPTELYHVAGSTLLLISVLMSPRLQRFFSVRPVRFLGYISFCLYLLHPLIIGTFGCFLMLKLYPQIAYMRAVMLSFATTCVFAVIAAYFMTNLVDKKGVQLSKYVYHRFFRRPELNVGST
jgi:peptidoglycan/LPS O-acetylase OafA/YrhL